MRRLKPQPPAPGKAGPTRFDPENDPELQPDQPVHVDSVSDSNSKVAGTGTIENADGHECASTAELQYEPGANG